MNRNQTPVAFLASVLIHVMVLFAAARWLGESRPVREIEPEAPPERMARVIFPPPEVWRPPAPPSQSRPPAAPIPPERPQPRPEAKDRVSIGGPSDVRQKTPLELRRDEDITRSVARGRPDAPGTPGSPRPAATAPPGPQAAARRTAPETEALSPGSASEAVDAPLAPSGPAAPPRPPGGPSIAGSLRNLEERLAEAGPRGLESGAGQQMGPLFFDPQGADFTAWINHFRSEVYRNWIVPPSVSLGARGHVDLEFRVERDGRLSALRIVRSSGTAALDRAARNALLGSRFLPLPNDFRPAQVAMQVSFFYNAVAGS